MIDKADFRVPARAQYRREFASMVKHAEASGGAGSIFRPSKLYDRTASFEPFGLPIILHESCKMTKQPNHKIEIIGAGDMTLGEMHEVAGFVFENEAWEYEALRIDLTADEEGVPVRWFRDHTVVDYKRQTREIGIIPESNFMTVGSGVAMTLYAGKKPRQIRIYNKTGERLARLMTERRKVLNYNLKANQRHAELVLKKGEESMLVRIGGGDAKAPELTPPDQMPIPTFEGLYGYSSDKVITRVESQINGKGLQDVGIETMHDLWRADEVEPFSRIRFVNDSLKRLDRSDWTAKSWCAGLWLQQEWRAHGQVSVKRLIGEIWGQHNVMRVWKEFAPFFQNEDRLCSYQKLQDDYVASTRSQLHAA